MEPSSDSFFTIASFVLSLIGAISVLSAAFRFVMEENGHRILKLVQRRDEALSAARSVQHETAGADTIIAAKLDEAAYAHSRITALTKGTTKWQDGLIFCWILLIALTSFAAWADHRAGDNHRGDGLGWLIFVIALPGVLLIFSLFFLIPRTLWRQLTKRKKYGHQMLKRAGLTGETRATYARDLLPPPMPDTQTHYSADSSRPSSRYVISSDEVPGIWLMIWYIRGLWPHTRWLATALGLGILLCTFVPIVHLEVSDEAPRLLHWVAWSVPIFYLWWYPHGPQTRAYTLYDTRSYAVATVLLTRSLPRRREGWRSVWTATGLAAERPGSGEALHLVDKVLAHPDGPRAWADEVGIPIELRASSDKLRDKYRARWPYLEETSSRKKLVYRPGSYSHQPPVTN